MKRIAAGLRTECAPCAPGPSACPGRPGRRGGAAARIADRSRGRTGRADARPVRRSSAHGGNVVSPPVTPGTVAFVAAPGDRDGGDHRVVAVFGLALGIAAGAGVVAVARARTSHTGPTTEGGTS